ncbi:MAG: acyl-CoA dehydratase activase-related protein, partial [Planctomycetota bacterium]
AFEAVTGKPVTVPPHHDVLGAIGCALIAMRELPNGPTKFRGFDLTKVKYTIDTFECKSCANHCEVRKVSIEGQKPLHYGSRCGKFDEEKRSKLGKDLPRLFNERENLLLNAYSKKRPDKPNGTKIGIPQIGLYYELFPLFSAFFTELGFEVLTSDNTNREIINDGLDTVLAEHCFPIKVAHGHLLNVLKKNVDYVFLPCIVNMPHLCDGMERSYVCPYVQSLPYLLKCAVDLSEYGVKPLETVFHFEAGDKEKVKSFLNLGKEIGVSEGKVMAALSVAEKVQDKFYQQMEKRGREILENLPNDSKALVIISRPYNGCDPALNLNLPEKLRDLGILAIPLDFLPLLDEKELSEDFPHMYWKYGQKILSGARIIARDPRLYAIYVTNFGCGPDSFISKFFAKELLGKPYLTIEIDEHAADVGAITRCEAFLDSLRNVKKKERRKVRSVKHHFNLNKDGRVLYIPYMDDHGIALAAALRSRGVKSEALPLSDDKSLELGKKYTTGKECYPCIITTGDFLKKAAAPDFDPDRAAFLMPDAKGPCRFGQYNRFHRLLLDELEYNNVTVIALDQTQDFNKDLEKLGAGFKRLAWKGIIITDMLKKMLFERRPYEVEQGCVEKTYLRLIHELESFLEKGAVLEVDRFPRYAISEFKKVPLDKSKKKPKIGIIGEIFVRSNEYTNNFIVRKVEKYNGQAALPAFEEWLNYIDYERKVDFKAKGNWTEIIGERIAQWVARRDKKKIQKQFSSVCAIENFCTEPETEHVLELGSEYIHEAVRGEAILSLGKCVEYAEAGYAGIVNLTPFQCLPGTIVNALLERFKKNFNHMPVLKMAYDGTQQSSEETRIEAFIHQCYSYAEEHNLL